jgi:UDP-N-acetylmuramyl pentapeptide phosphotransferase/UDP-N-acetylglucosamine-1-phosphate transferase
MRRARLTTAFLIVAFALLALAPVASAHAGGGQGWYGESSDKAVTTAMFAVIIFFPLIIVLFSVIQARLDKRKHARVDAAKRRAASVDWRGGW